MTALKNLKLKRGFTLIELLIVIAILGVLAVVVLVAINPVQQLARTRDAGRVSSVSQLGHAVEAYYTAHNGTYPTNAEFTDSDTTNVLVTSGEINTLPGLVANSLSTECDADGWCYDTDVTSFVVYSTLEADTNLTINATAGCDGTAAGYSVYQSVEGRTCIVCGVAPTAVAPGTCAN